MASPSSLELHARRALLGIEREYPNQITHLMAGGDDRPPTPRERTPVFYGCFDWHSAVHAHWLLARVAGEVPGTALGATAGRALVERLRPEPLRAEASFLMTQPAFERPYGLAWLLALDREVRGLEDGEVLAAALRPLTEVARARFSAWLPKLGHPVRSGVHSQTAFALGLVLDWSRAVGDDALTELVCNRARDFFGSDRDYPLHLEPSGEDFLSPSLGAADLMRRVMLAPELAEWLGRTMPELLPVPLSPVVPSDRSDGRLAHLDGLCLSRAFMMRAIATALPDGDPRVTALRASANEHAGVGLASTRHNDYAGTHWLGTFAVYLLTQRA